MNSSIRIFTLLIFMFQILFVCYGQNSTTFYVSPLGSDSNSGNRQTPFASVQHALESAFDNDKIIILSGVYRDPVRMSNMDKKVSIIGEGCGVILSGTTSLPENWKKHRNGIWKQKLDYDVWQMFNEKDMVYLARWPDASFEDSTMWRMTRCMRSAEGGYDNKKQEYFGKCKPGLIWDANFQTKDAAGFHEGDSRYIHAEATESLAESGKDFTGAVAVLNIGHWLTWARPVTEHKKGSDHFRYEHTDDIRPRPFWVWYMLGLEALDRPNEWWFDKDTRTIYFMPPEGENPNNMDLHARTKDFILELDQCSDISFENIDFFSAGFFVNESRNISFTDCNFFYPSTHKFGLGHYQMFDYHNPEENPNKMISLWKGEGHRIVNCEFAFCNSPVYLGGENTLIENCLFHDIEWDVNSGSSSGSVMMGKGARFISNTVYLTGNSEGVRPLYTKGEILLNHIWDLGNLQHDGAAINVGTRNQENRLVAYNWVHDCNRQGIRFDYYGMNILREDKLIYGDGVYSHNVSWRTQPNQVKGNRHLILNNTIVSSNYYLDPETEEMNFSIQGFKCMHGIMGNEHSLTRNNIANMTHRSWSLMDSSGISAYKIPGQVDHNNREKGAAFKYLCDPENFDFRPKFASPLIDAGEIVSPNEIQSPISRFNGISWIGKAPDIGAYEYGDIRYWIPGRKESTSSTPIPKNGALNVPLDADLMFLEAYLCSKHRVWLGDSPGNLDAIAELEDATTNIVKPYVLKPGTTYYWRVDALKNEEVIKGQVWSFKTVEN